MIKSINICFSLAFELSSLPQSASGSFWYGMMTPSITLALLSELSLCSNRLSQESHDSLHNLESLDILERCVGKGQSLTSTHGFPVKHFLLIKWSKNISCSQSFETVLYRNQASFGWKKAVVGKSLIFNCLTSYILNCQKLIKTFLWYTCYNHLPGFCSYCYECGSWL